MADRVHRIIAACRSQGPVGWRGPGPAGWHGQARFHASASVLAYPAKSPSHSPSPNTLGHATARCAFTLVELLTVVSIIALLLAILLPSLRNAREQARTAVCGSNLRQIALANELYAADNQQRYCPGAIEFMLKNLHRWHGTRDHASQPFDGRGGPLVPYLGPEGNIRACPSMRIDLPEDDQRRFEKNCGGYGYNLAFLGRQLEKVGGGWYRMMTDGSGAQTDRVRCPAQTIMFTDSGFLDGMLIEYSFGEPRFFPLYGTRPIPSIHFRHNKRANVVWCDGHVDWQHRTFTRGPSPYYEGDPSRNNLGWFGIADDNRLFDLE
ncbi:MAG: H-X9-DG-CTERM domain-containing protein [Planctomycetota bacterium]